MTDGSPVPERLDAILDQEEDIDYDFEPEPSPHEGSDMEEDGPDADSKPEGTAILPAEDPSPAPQQADDAARHSKQSRQEAPKASERKASASTPGPRRSSSRTDIRPVRDERHQSEPSRPRSATRQQSARGSRYFLLKSISLENIEISVAQGIWATQKHNEEKLNKAYSTCGAVYLIFSVNGRGNFQGWARMTSKITHGQNRREANWQGKTLVGNTFKVEWQRRHDLGMSVTNHLTNPWNEGKPVRIGRDGQEMPSTVGEELVDIIEESAKAQHVPRPAKAYGRHAAVHRTPAKHLRSVRINDPARPALRPAPPPPTSRLHAPQDPLPAAPQRITRLPPVRHPMPLVRRDSVRDLPYLSNDSPARDTFHQPRPQQHPHHDWTFDQRQAQPTEGPPEWQPATRAHNSTYRDKHGYPDSNTYANSHAAEAPAAPLQEWSQQQRRQPELRQGFAEWDCSSRPLMNGYRDDPIKDSPAAQAQGWSHKQHSSRQPLGFHPTADYSVPLSGTDWSYHPEATQQQQHMDYHSAEQPRHHHSAGHQHAHDRSCPGPGLRHGQNANGSSRIHAAEPMTRSVYRGRQERHLGYASRQPSTHLADNRPGCSKRGRSRSFSPQRQSQSSKRGCRPSGSQHQPHARLSLLDFHSYEEYADYIEQRGRQDVEPWGR
ncbi:hypothetical protein WJX74_000461 [Apatococcus lobatus]|uniref:YTH domain-containing protein n=1 Tax=Apatococcus lobatus TaxID=904363 RepID=A0AAW1QZG3_9CHLO